MIGGIDRWQLLQDLFDGLLKALHGRMKADPSVADLSVARRFLRDQGEAVEAHDEADRKRFAAIRKLYIQRLHEALEGDPSAATLREVLAFLNAAGIVEGIGSYMDAHKALVELSTTDLPFQ